MFEDLEVSLISFIFSRMVAPWNNPSSSFVNILSNSVYTLLSSSPYRRNTMVNWWTRSCIRAGKFFYIGATIKIYHAFTGIQGNLACDRCFQFFAGWSMLDNGDTMPQNLLASFFIEKLNSLKNFWCRVGVAGAKISLVLRYCDTEVGPQYTKVWVT